MITSSTVSRVFTGMLEVGDETVPATVNFFDGSISLVVADDEVGNWPTPDVDFVGSEGGYDIHAEGDSIRFVPDADQEFEAFLQDPEAERPTREPLAPDPGDPAPDVPLGGGADLLSPLGTDEDEEAAPAPFGGAGGTEPLGLGLAGEDPVTGDDPAEEGPSGLAVEPVDEFYAAGLAGPDPDLPRPVFRSALTRANGSTPASAQAPVGRSDGAGDATRGEVAPAPLPSPAAYDDIPVELAPETPAADDEMVQEPAAELPEPVDEPPATHDASEEEGRPSSGGSPLATMLSRLRTRPGEAEPADAPDDDLPTPISDTDTLKQWALVAAGGVVLMAIVGVVVWGLVSIMGGDEPATVAEAEPVPTTAPPPPPTVPTTVPTTAPPPTAVPPENLAAAEAFVASWNEIARDYAYHLTIGGDALPISTAPAPTVHLTYGEDGILELTMAPKGSGSDRDILVAMGLAVTWADPGLTPDGRKQVLAEMGIDVDNPQVGDMGGDLDRNGVTYSTTVSDGIIRFRVDPAG